MSSRYDLFIEPAAHAERKQLPGHVRQRIRGAITDLATEPRPTTSAVLDLTGLEVPPHIEVRRIRLGHWRVIYAVDEAERWVWVWGIRRRPPYDYDDLQELTAQLD